MFSIILNKQGEKKTYCTESWGIFLLRGVFLPNIKQLR